MHRSGCATIRPDVPVIPTQLAKRVAVTQLTDHLTLPSTYFHQWCRHHILHGSTLQRRLQLLKTETTGRQRIYTGSSTPPTSHVVIQNIVDRNEWAVSSVSFYIIVLIMALLGEMIRLDAIAHGGQLDPLIRTYESLTKGNSILCNRTWIPPLITKILLSGSRWRSYGEYIWIIGPRLPSLF